MLRLWGLSSAEARTVVCFGKEFPKNWVGLVVVVQLWCLCPRYRLSHPGRER